ncbi:4Fe-4S binding protein [Desulfocicer niacini]
MAHHVTKSSHARLVDRLNRFPQGAPPSDLLYKILKVLFTEREAGLVSLLPIKPFTVEKAARIWKMDRPSARRVLDTLAEKAILVDITMRKETHYVLPPPMAGFFEFSMMRVRTDVDQKVLSELFYQYLNVEEDFVKNLFTLGETQLGRTFVHEPALSAENMVQVLDYERASEVIKTASHRGISLCYCRHKMLHRNQACGAPLDICMTFNTSAASLIKHGHARSVDVVEGLDLLQTAYDNHLVQFGENVRERVNFICNCCGCCCEAMLAAQRFGMLNPVHTTNFLPQVDDEECSGCGKCVDVCPVQAMSLVTVKDPARPRLKKAVVDETLCLGCGVCVRACPGESIHLISRERRVITPLDGVHRAVVMAIERGTLHEMLFDNKVLFSHRALAAVFGVILRLSPVKRILASKQVKSRYLEKLMSHTPWAGAV